MRFLITAKKQKNQQRSQSVETPTRNQPKPTTKDKETEISTPELYALDNLINPTASQDNAETSKKQLDRTSTSSTETTTSAESVSLLDDVRRTLNTAR